MGRKCVQNDLKTQNREALKYPKVGITVLKSVLYITRPSVHNCHNRRSCHRQLVGERPRPRQIGDGGPVPVPGQVGDGSDRIVLLSCHWGRGRGSGCPTLGGCHMAWPGVRAGSRACARVAGQANPSCVAVCGAGPPCHPRRLVPMPTARGFTQGPGSRTCWIIGSHVKQISSMLRTLL
jgi:hypothetical protein